MYVPHTALHDWCLVPDVNTALSGWFRHRFPQSLFTEQSPSGPSAGQQITKTFMEPESWLPWSLEPAADSYPESVQSRLYPQYLIYFRSILISFSHLHMGLVSGLFRRVLHPKFCRRMDFFSLRCACHCVSLQYLCEDLHYIIYRIRLLIISAYIQMLFSLLRSEVLSTFLFMQEPMFHARTKQHVKL